MTIDEMREMPPTELHSEAEKLLGRIWKLRFQAKGEPVENPGELKQLKKERARILTVLREMELAGAHGRGRSGAAAGGSQTTGGAGE